MTNEAESRTALSGLMGPLPAPDTEALTAEQALIVPRLRELVRALPARRRRKRAVRRASVMVGAVLGAGLSTLVWYERDAQRLPFTVETGTSTPLANAGHGFVTSANETTALRTRGGALVAVASSSRVESITAETNREQVLLDRGSVHVRVPGLPPGGSFTVKTPDALVRVKGTTFSVTVASTPRGTETCVKVEEGVVWVERSGTRVVLMKGQHDKCAAFGVNAPGSEPHTTLGSALKSANAGAPTRSRPPERRGTGQSSSSRSPTNGTFDSAILAEQNRLLALALRAERAGHPKEAKQRLQQLLARYPVRAQGGGREHPPASAEQGALNRSSLPRVRYSAALAILAGAGSAGCSDDVLQLGGTPQAAEAGSVDRLILRDAASTAPIGDLIDVTSISIAALESKDVSIEAVVSGAVASVEFFVDGNTFVEHRVPFTYPGDTDGRLFSFAAEVGMHSVKATPYGALGALGERGTSLEATLVFIE